MGPEDVREAARRIAGRVWHTPLIRCPSLDERAGVELFFKAENLQRIGAFKARGAMNAVSRLDPAVRTRGMVTYSSGNHAQAVALAAREHGAPAFVAMPTDAPRVKVEAVRALGARVVMAGTSSSERRQAALALVEQTGGTLIEPFDDADVIAGQGTAALELLEDAGAPLDAVLVPVGGGGLLAGTCLACAATGTKVYAVEPIGADAMTRSLAAGERVTIPLSPTLADGLRPVQVGALNFAIAREHVAGCLSVNDDEIGSALVELLYAAKLLVEPSGAVALAAALRGGLPANAVRVGVLLTGGNVEPHVVRELVGRYSGPSDRRSPA